MNKLEENPALKIKRSLSTGMSMYFRKTLHTFDIIGCSQTKFLEWINYQLIDTPNFTLANYGKIWHLDHCLPCALFDFSDEEQQKTCYHWSNISPLSAISNMSKLDKIIPEYLLHQQQKYNIYLNKEKMEDPQWSINFSYNRIVGGALTTTVEGKPSDGTRGNDLGRFMKYDIVKTSEIGQSAAKLPYNKDQIRDLIANVKDMQLQLQSIRELL